MRLLAADTTSRAGSVAFLEEEELLGVVGFTNAPGHAETLLPALDALLRGLRLSLSEVDAHAVAIGPGSFTGLRIGMATMEGLSYATGQPLVGVSALEATAYRYRLRAGLVASFLDARRGEVFGALYRSDGQELEPVIEPVCESPHRFLERLPPEPILVAGSGIREYEEILRKRMGDRLRLGERSFFLAEEVARIGLRLHREGKASRLGALEAIYLRPSDAEKPRAERSRVSQ